MEISTRIASDITLYSKYARYLPSAGRRETWEEIVDRYESMLAARYPTVREPLRQAAALVREKKILPSMRALQFAGKAIEVSHSRIYNCSYMAASYPRFFAELMYLLLGGTGVGFSVQARHTSALPAIQKPAGERPYLIGDSIAGWADAVDALMQAFLTGAPLPRFDYSAIRPLGARLETAGGKAPGPGPLRLCLDKILFLLEKTPSGSRLTPIQVCDIACLIADAVLSGGIRRAAMICLFDITDAAMLTYKQDSWWETQPQRARVNVSAVAFREDVRDDGGEFLAHATSESEFRAFWKSAEESRSGEPGIYWSNHPDWGTNPCAEIGLRHRQFCNLTTVNFSAVANQQELEKRVRAAAVLGTLQAGFTDFVYLGKEWSENARAEALLGVSLTGIADQGDYRRFDFRKAAAAALSANAEIARSIGINPAARVTCIKPEGTASLVLGTSSGVHGRHAPYYLRRFRFKITEPIAEYFMRRLPNLVEKDRFDPEGVILELPQQSPSGAILRSERALDLLERVKYFRSHWVEPGHRTGLNMHNVSCTVSVRDDEWREVGDWMWQNRAFYNGIAVLPFEGGSYVQAPFEEIDADRFSELRERVQTIDLSEVMADQEEPNRIDQIACGGNECEI